MRGAPTRDEALVLRTLRLGESSKIVSALTREHGRVKLVARGARRVGDRLGSLLEPGNQIEIVHYPRPGHDLWTLSDAFLRRAVLTGASSLDKLSHLLAALELADRLLEAQEPQPEVEELYRNFLDHWHQQSAPAMPALFFGLELGLLDRLGLGLSVEACVDCGRSLEGEDRMLHRPADGGLLCSGCARGGGRALDAEQRGELLRVTALLERGEELHLSDRARRQVGRILHDHMSFHLPQYRVPRALYWLADGKRERGTAP